MKYTPQYLRQLILRCTRSGMVQEATVFRGLLERNWPEDWRKQILDEQIDSATIERDRRCLAAITA